MIPVDALIEEPASGAWVADIATTDKPTGVFELGESTWTGAIASPGAKLDGSRWRCRVVGGAGKLGSTVPEKNYVNAVPWSHIASDIIREAGEKAGPLTAPGQATYYERARGTAGQTLAELCAAAGATWWVSRDGLVCMAPARPAGPVVETDASRVAFDVDGTVVLNARVAADVLPGQTLDGKTIAALRWSLEPQRLTVECSFSAVTFPDQRDRFYDRTYSAKVEQQNGDGTVDVIANALFRLSRVPLLSGIPGAVLKMLPGDLVAVGFFGGNRSTPYAVATLQGGSNAQPIALNGDTVTMLLPPFAFNGFTSTGPISGVMTALTGQTLGTVTGPSSARTKLE